jgi:hypothetical protein
MYHRRLRDAVDDELRLASPRRSDDELDDHAAIRCTQDVIEMALNIR